MRGLEMVLSPLSLKITSSLADSEVRIEYRRFLFDHDMD